MNMTQLADWRNTGMLHRKATLVWHLGSRWIRGGTSDREPRSEVDRRCWLQLTIWTSDNSEIERMYIVTPTVTAWPGHDVKWKDVIIIGCCLAFFSLHVKTGNCKSGDNSKMILLTSWKFSWLMIWTFVRVMIEWQICCSMMNDEIDTLLWDSLQKCNSYWSGRSLAVSVQL